MYCQVWWFNEAVKRWAVIIEISKQAVSSIPAGIVHGERCKTVGYGLSVASTVCQCWAWPLRCRAHSSRIAQRSSSSVSARAAYTQLATSASPAMGHWGTSPPRLPANYFGDHSLYRHWRVMRTVFCPVERFLAIGSADCHWIVALLCSRYRWERVVGYCSWTVN